MRKAADGPAPGAMACAAQDVAADGGSQLRLPLAPAQEGLADGPAPMPAAACQAPSRVTVA